MTCPRCGSRRVHRIPAPWLQGKVMRLLVPGRRLQRCHVCGWRGYAPWTHHRSRARPEEIESWTPKPAGEPDLAAIDEAVGKKVGGSG